MIKQSWTPDNCPLQVGSVLHNVNTNTDYIVLARCLDYTGEHGTDSNTALVAIQYFKSDNSHWLSGEDLNDPSWEYYPNWPNASVTAPCYSEVEEPGITDTEFIQTVFDTAKKLPGVSKLFEVSDRLITTWDNDAHAIIQENVAAILRGLKECVEEKNE